MPAIDIEQGPQKLSRFDVVGAQVDRQTRFIRHVAFLGQDIQSLEAGDEVTAVHMCPPLEDGGRIKVHVAGRVPLTNDEVKEIESWWEEIADEYKRLGIRTASQYVIRPPWKDEYDPNTGIRRYRRYSCAGFVLDGHLQVNIELLNTSEAKLPPVDRQTIISAYPRSCRHTNLLSSYGLEGNGPWNVVLAGYVLHALNRPTEQIRKEPYQAKQGDEQF